VVVREADAATEGKGTLVAVEGAGEVRLGFVAFTEAVEVVGLAFEPAELRAGD
jgi:hypothetical protein